MHPDMTLHSVQNGQCSDRESSWTHALTVRNHTVADPCAITIKLQIIITIATAVINSIVATITTRMVLLYCFEACGELGMLRASLVISELSACTSLC